MPATTNLPPGYHCYKTLNLSRSIAVLGMNLLAIPLLFLFGWFFSSVLNYIRPLNSYHGGLLGLFRTFSLLALLFSILSIILMLLLHELVHGIVFWLYSREKPKFAVKPGYAYAAAPEWFFTRIQYVFVGLSPLLIITCISIILAFFVTKIMLPYLLLIATFNAAGSLGDLIVVGWVLSQPKTILVQDEGDIFTTYSPEIL